MDESSVKQVRAAAGAAWCTILIFAIYLTLAWGAILLVLHYRPAVIIQAWGSGTLTWDEVHRIILWAFGALKLVLLTAVMVALWLTLYARRLARS